MATVRMAGIDPPVAQQRAYERAFRRLAAVIWAHLRASTLPAYAASDRERSDDLSTVLRRSLAALAAKLRRESKRVAADAEKIGAETDRRHKAEFYARAKRAVGVDVVGGEGFRGKLLDKWNRENTDLIESVSTSAVASMRTEIEQAFASGVRAEALAKRWRERGLPLEFGTVEGRAKVIARDQIGKLNGQLTQARQEALGIEEYAWRTSRDQRVRDSHADREGKRYRWDRPPDDGHPGHPVQCFPADARVWSPGGADLLFRRWYQGPGVELQFQNGVLLSTPNHPVLTARGWVAAKDVKEGDYLVEASSELAGSGENDRHEVSFGDLAELCDRAVLRRFVGGEFHGDASVEDEIDVVDVHGALGVDREAPSDENLSELALSMANHLGLGAGDRTKGVDAARLAADSSMSGLGETAPIGRARAPHTLDHRVASATDVDSSIAKPPRQDVAPDASVARDALDRLAVRVALTKVLEVRRDRELCGWVHNLNVRSGWYICNGIVVHNCRCVAEAIIDVEKIAASAAARAEPVAA